jgi:1,4-alpha-glucan branching enzyme
MKSGIARERSHEVQETYRHAAGHEPCPESSLAWVDEVRVQRFVEGREHRAHEVFGAHPVDEAHPVSTSAERGTRFVVWAPNAHSVSLMGDMNHWNAERNPMHPIGSSGTWVCFVPGTGPGVRYKYRICDARGRVHEKADPFARSAEVRPCSASVIAPSGSAFVWNDASWLQQRAQRQSDEAPISIYEVHLGSWRHDADHWLSYRDLAQTLVPYAADLGFTHLELLPIMEHPLDASWGYQPLGLFAPTSRHGTPDDLRHFIDRAHAAGLGVILDWVPGHFPTDGHGLATFDGTPLFEAMGPNGGRHPDWGTLSFDFNSPAVRSFLISSALYWLEEFHVDGLRVDAVASMLYLDYSRRAGEWEPNEHGGRENFAAASFLRELNEVVHRACPGTLMIAEESTAWPGVSHGVDRGGLGFDQKWNMGWMNDTLEATQLPASVRRHAHERFTFSLLYAFSERFVLPFSHDEVVHGKRSLLSKMPGSYDEQFAALRALLALQWLHPGKKLLFMGCEFGQWSEWNHDGQLDWALLDFESHRGVQQLVRALNRLYRETPALHRYDFRPEGFEWLDCHDRERLILSFVRWAPGWRDPVLVVANLLPFARPNFCMPAPWAGRYELCLNTDAFAAASHAAPPNGAPAGALFEAQPGAVAGRDWHLQLSLPGLSVLALRYAGE